MNGISRMLFIGALMILAGCVASSANVPNTYELDPESENGLLIGSVKYIGLLSGYKVYFDGVDNGSSGYLEAGKGKMILPIPPKSDFKNIKGNLLVRELPPGLYEISRWEVVSGAAYLYQTEPFRIRFRIQSGVATYIGSFVFTVTDRLGLAVTGVSVDYRDKYAEDVEMMRTLYPSLTKTEVVAASEVSDERDGVGGRSFLRWSIAPVF